MSKYDNERKKMGLSTSNTKSKYAQERELLYNGTSNLVHDQMNLVKSALNAPSPLQQEIKSRDLLHNQLNLPSMLNKIAPVKEERMQPDNQDMPTNYPGGLLNPLNVLGHVANSPIVRSFDYAAGKSIGIPEELLQPPKSTGNKFADAATNFVGQGAGMFVNPASLENGLIQGGYKAAENFGATKVGQKAGQLGAKAANKVNPLLNQVGIHLSPQLANQAVNNAARGAAAGAIYGAGQSVIQGDMNPADIAKSAGENALLFGGGDAALPLLGAGAKAAGQKLSGTSIGKISDNLYTKLFGDKGVGISAVNSTKKISKGPLTTEGQIVSRPIKNDIEGIKNNAQAIAKSTYQDYVDALAPLKKISPEAYNKSIDAARSSNIANTIVHDKFVNPQGEVIGDSLKDVFSQVPRGQSKKFVDYLVLRHAKTRMSRGEKVYDESLNMTPEKVQERINTLSQRNPAFETIAQKWDKYNENMLKTYGVDEGLLSEEMFKTLREQNPNYAPMRRQFSLSEKFASPFGVKARSAFSGQKAPIKEVSPTGSTRRIVDPRRTTIEATGAWVNASMRNRVMQSIADKILQNPAEMKGIAEIVQKPKGQPSLKEILGKDGQDGFLESLNEDFNKLFQRTRLDKDNIVRAMIKGEPVYIKVNDPEAVKALVGLGPEQSNIVMDFFGALSNATKYGATGPLAPVFAIKGLTYDIGQSIIQSKNPLVHIFDLGHAVLSSLADTLPKNTPGIKDLRALAQDFRRTGGEYSSVLRGEKPLRRSVRNLNKNPLLSPQGIATGLTKTVAAPFKTLHKISDIAENANRMAAFKGELRNAERTPENITKAMNAAREITTNYSRKGAKSQSIEKFIPYNNAAVQSLYRFAKQWKMHPVKTSALVGGAVLIPKAIEYFRFANDPDYNNLPARERYRFLMVNKNADGTFVKVPMPPEWNALGAGMVDLLRYYKDNNKEAFQGAADALVNAYTPPLISGAAQSLTQGGGLEQSIAGATNATVLSPIASTLSNKDFAGRPIEPAALQDRSPQYRYDEQTSAAAKTLGQALQMSPKKVDYIIRSYGGDPARLLLPLTSQVGKGQLRNTVLRNFIVDPTFSNNLSTQFYGAKDRLSQAYRDNIEAGVPLPSWYDDNLRKQVTSQAKGSVSKQLSALSGQKKQVNANPALTPQEKTAKLRNIQQQINKIYIDINSKMDEAKVPMR